jgi:hypothetical protein
MYETNTTMNKALVIKILRKIEYLDGNNDLTLEYLPIPYKLIFFHKEQL